MLHLNFNPFPALTTERLLLRQIKFYDAEELFFLRSDEELMKYICKPKAQSLDEIHDFIGKITRAIENNEGITWAIAKKRSFKLIGTIGFWRIQKEHYRAEIGYTLRTAFQGQGIMQEALNAILSYGFETLKLHSVEANADPGNSASIRLLEKNRFQREGYFRENYYFNGDFLDTVSYSLINPASHDQQH